MNQSERELPLAIVGLGCHLPGAENFRAYARLLLEGRSSIRELPAERFDQAIYYDPKVGAAAKSYCRLGGIIDDHPFDADAFGYNPEQAEALDPLHRWVLEVARAALADAGLDPFGLCGANIGVVLGHSRGSNRCSDAALATTVEQLFDDFDSAGPELADDDLRQRVRQAVIDEVRRRDPSRPGTSPTIFRSSNASALVARAFGLTGRHLVVDAACASSLAAMAIAARALRQKSIDMALVGGAAFSSSLSMVLFSQARALSPHGSFPFDARADGFISSDGVGMCLVARLDDALERGLPIRALVHGIGSSCDGRGKGLWAPNQKGQVLALEDAYCRGAVDPAQVGYVEAHGTSTALGDATEVASLTEFFGSRRQPGAARMPIGSVKSNIGHCREAAGIAGLLKVIVAFEQETIPASINYREPNPEIDWSGSPVFLATEPTAWPRSDRALGEAPRIAGIDSFGIGGLNYHVVVEEPPTAARIEELLSRGGSPRRAGKRNGSANGASPVLAAGPSGGKPHTAEPIAIVGIGCLLPGARGPQEFWKQLCEGHVAVGEVPPSRWSTNTYYRPGGGERWSTYCRRGGFITDFTPDWRRYRMPPRLAEHIDPLQLMLLDCALAACADAGVDLAAVDRRRISVSVGSIFGSDYALQIAQAIRAPEIGLILDSALRHEGVPAEQAAETTKRFLSKLRARLPEISEDSSASATSSTLASRIATSLDLHGATLAVESCTSSSLAALEVACESLWAEQCDMALWAGADRGMSIQRFVDACRVGNLSHSESFSPFAAAADGMLLGEGVVVCMLERESHARAAGRPIYATIRTLGSATAFAPSGHGGRLHAGRLSDGGDEGGALVCAAGRAHERSSVDPSSIAYVEAVGVGTPRRDRAVVDAARRTLGSAGREQPILLGSAQANVGHTQGAAGAVAVVKTALALRYGTLPPTPSRQAGAADLLPDLELCSGLVPYPVLNGRARGLVSATVDGGVNYHIVLEAPAAPPAGEPAAADAQQATAAEPILVRGSNRAQVAELLTSLAQPGAPALSPASAYGAGAVTVALRSGEGLAERLQLAAKTLASPAASIVVPSAGIAVTDFTLPDETCFLFPGQGSQYAGMCRDVVRHYPAAALVLAEIDELLVRFGHGPLSRVLWEETDRLHDVLWTQMAVLGGNLMMLEVARAHGLRPAMITGHSYGDYAALVAAGCWSLEQVVLTTVLRCESILAVGSEGGMAALFTSRARVAELLEGLPGFAAASNVNAPDEVVVSGDPVALDALLARCEREGVTARRLSVPRPFHCELMQEAAALIERSVDHVELKAPQLPFLSSTGARLISSPEELRAALVAQFTLPVDFVAQIEVAYAAGCRRFVEIGPGNVLARLTSRILAGRPAVVTSLDDKKLPGLQAIEVALAALRAHDATSAGSAAAGGGEQAPSAGAASVNIRPGEIRFVDVTIRRQGEGAPAARNGSARSTTQPPVVVQSGATEESKVSADAKPRSLLEEIEERLIQLVCKQSGYPRDLVALQADLEADLGIDTVKQMQILGQIRELYDLRADDRLAMRDVPTLRLLADYVERAVRSALDNSEDSSQENSQHNGHHNGEHNGRQNGVAVESVADAGAATIEVDTRGPIAVRHVAAADLLNGAAQATGTMAPAGDFDLAALEARTAKASRMVLRTVASPLEEAAPVAYRPDRLVMLGGGAVAGELRAVLEARGTQVVIVELSGDPSQVEQQFESALGDDPLPDVCLLAGVDRLSNAGASLDDLAMDAAAFRARLVEGPFRALQIWVKRLHSHPRADATSRPTLSAVTALGGALGHWNAGRSLPEGGAVVGFFKAMRREFPELRYKVLDCEAGEEPAVAAAALLAELDATDECLEAGLLRGVRQAVRISPLPARLDPERLAMLRRLPYVILTGGARGITAELALRLVEIGVRRLHLVGKTPLPVDIQRLRDLDAHGLEAARQETLETLRAGGANVSPAEWEAAFEPTLKALEIDRNLRRLAAAGATATYHAVDVSDGPALAELLDTLRLAEGPVRAIVHAAGYQCSRAFLSKRPNEVEATLRPKLDGTLHLLRLTQDDPLELFVSFSSVAGRFGGLGQTDYSLASEMLARLTGAAAAARPRCRTVAISWPAWANVGMAAHRKTKHLLEKHGRRFLDPAEGGDHFLRELLAVDPEAEVVFGSDLESLDLDRLIPRGAEAALLEKRNQQAWAQPLADGMLDAGPRHAQVECRLDADRDPFLVQHRMGTTAILPAVIALELLAETALLSGGERAIASLEDVEIVAGLRLSDTRRLSMRCEGRREGSEVDLTLRAPHIGRNAKLIELDRTLVVGRAKLGAPVLGAVVPRIERPARSGAFLYGQAFGASSAAEWYHGPALRGLEELGLGKESLHWGKIRGLDCGELRTLRSACRWWLPAAVLDSCLAACAGIVRLKFDTEGLPTSFGRVSVGRLPRVGETCELAVRERGRDARKFYFDFTVYGDDGTPLLNVERYALHTFARLGAKTNGHRAEPLGIAGERR